MPIKKPIDCTCNSFNDVYAYIILDFIRVVQALQVFFFFFCCGWFGLICLFVSYNSNLFFSFIFTHDWYKKNFTVIIINIFLAYVLNGEDCRMLYHNLFLSCICVCAICQCFFNLKEPVITEDRHSLSTKYFQQVSWDSSNSCYALSKSLFCIQ